MTTGLYDVRVSKDSESFDLADVFTVTDGPVGEVSVTIIGPSAVRPGRQGTVLVVYGNIGETDVMAPILSIRVFLLILTQAT